MFRGGAVGPSRKFVLLGSLPVRPVHALPSFRRRQPSSRVHGVDQSLSSRRGRCKLLVRLCPRRPTPDSKQPLLGDKSGAHETGRTLGAKSRTFTCSLCTWALGRVIFHRALAPSSSAVKPNNHPPPLVSPRTPLSSHPHCAGAFRSRRLTRTPPPMRTKITAPNSKNQPQYCVGCATTRTR
jgi:hypothetical protein